MMNNNTRKFALIVTLLSAALLVLVVYVASSAPGKSPVTIEQAALDGLAEIGWDTTGFAAELVKTEGSFARVSISTANGGFSAIMQRQGSTWGVVAHGSAFNPADLEALSVPLSILE